MKILLSFSDALVSVINLNIYLSFTVVVVVGILASFYSTKSLTKHHQSGLVFLLVIIGISFLQIYGAHYFLVPTLKKHSISYLWVMGYILFFLINLIATLCGVAQGRQKGKRKTTVEETDDE